MKKKILNVTITCIIIISIFSGMFVLIIPDTVRAGSSYYVSTIGSDSYNGLYPTYQGGSDGPWLTLPYAMSLIGTGDILYILEGEYEITGGTLPINIKSDITISNYNDGNVIINGTGLDYEYGIDSFYTSVFLIEDSDNIRITGLTINHSYRGAICVDNSDYVTIDNCSITNCSTWAIKTINNPIYLTFEYNYVYFNMNDWTNYYYSQETISLENCDYFNINNNTCLNNNAILIDLKGGSCIGNISHNKINNTGLIQTHSDCYWFGGTAIQIDAQGIEHNITIDHNNIYGNQTGISINTESTGHYEYIYIYNNLINITSLNGDEEVCTPRFPISISNTGGSSDDFHHVYIYSNDIITKDENSRNCIVVLNFNSNNLYDVYIFNNILYAEYTGANYYLLTVWYLDYDDDYIKLSNNSFYRAGTIRCYWDGNTYYHYANPEKFGDDANFSDPKFIDYDTDFHLRYDSPCIDIGNSTLISSYDFDGISRPQGDDYDIGAYEFEYEEEEETGCIGEVYLIPNDDILTGCNKYPDTGHNYGKVDDTPGSPDGTTTYVYTTTSGNYVDMYNCNNHTSQYGPINFVRVYIRCRNNYESSYHACYVGLRYNSINYYGDYHSLHGDENWHTFYYDWNVRPNDAQEWTWTNIDNLGIGVKLYYDSAGHGTLMCTQVYMEVNYTSIMAVQTNASTGIGLTNATLKGYILNDNCTDVSGFFQYGLTTSYGTSTSKQYPKNSLEEFSTNIQNLIPDTTYHYRAVINTTSNYAYGSDTSFTTEAISSPANVTGTLTGSTLNITWDTGEYATDTTLVVRKVGSYPTNSSDGTIEYNGTLEYYEYADVNASDFFTLFSYNDTIVYFSDGVDVTFGGFYINVYNETNHVNITCWNITVSNEEGTQVYSAICCNNTYLIDLNSCPTGENIAVIISHTDYKQRVYYYDFTETTQGTLNAYLPPLNDAYLYYLRVVETITTEYTNVDHGIEGAKVYVKRYINATDTFENISILLTDANGYCNVYLIPEIYLIVEIQKTLYTTKYSDYIPQLPNEWGQTTEKWFRIVLISETESGGIPYAEDVYTNITFSFYPYNTQHHSVFTFYFNITSSDNQLQWYRLDIYFYNVETETWDLLDQLNESDSGGGSLQYTIPDVLGRYAFKCYYKKIGYPEKQLGEIGSLIYFYLALKETLETVPDYAWYLITIVITIVAMGFFIRYFGATVMVGYAGLGIMAIMFALKNVTIYVSDTVYFSGWIIWGITFFVYTMGVFLYTRL